MALADSFDGFLIDLDGVVWVGRELLPGAAEALRELLGQGKEIVFVTNNPGRSGAGYAKRLAEAGVYNNVAFHRVAPGFVIQTGALNTRAMPLTEKQQKLVHNLTPEFNDTKHVKGIVSMARGEAPDSATTSFFICTGASTALDGQYTAFGRVVDGMSVVDAIEQTPRDGETPKARIELRSVKIERK